MVNEAFRSGFHTAKIAGRKLPPDMPCEAIAAAYLSSIHCFHCFISIKHLLARRLQA
jgi:hypothetical protein